MHYCDKLGLALVRSSLRI